MLWLPGIMTHVYQHHMCHHRYVTKYLLLRATRNPALMVCIYLQYGHFVPQLALLLGGEAKLVDDFDSYVPARHPVLS